MNNIVGSAPEVQTEMSEVREVAVVPSRDITAAQYYRYRGEGGRLIESIRLFTPDGDYVIRRSEFQQLFRYLDVNVSDLRRIRDYKKRDVQLLGALLRCDTELVLSVAGDRIIRIVTPDFTALPHSEVLQIIQSALGPRYQKRELDFWKGMFAKWHLTQVPQQARRVGQIVSWQLWAYNYNTGDCALKIGAGYTVLKCMNGAVDTLNSIRFRVIHRGDHEAAVCRIRSAVDTIINEYIPVIARRIEAAQEARPKIDLVRKFVYFYPIWIQNKLLRELEGAGTVWDVSNAFSYVASHAPVTFNQRLQLANDAVRVLRLTREK